MPSSRPAGAAVHAHWVGRRAGSREHGHPGWAAPAPPHASHSQWGLWAQGGRAWALGRGVQPLARAPLPAQVPQRPSQPLHVWLHIVEGAPGCPSMAGAPRYSQHQCGPHPTSHPSPWVSAHGQTPGTRTGPLTSSQDQGPPARDIWGQPVVRAQTQGLQLSSSTHL